MRMVVTSLVLFLPSIASAQDMALHEILKEGETWKKVDGKFATVGGLNWNVDTNKLGVFDMKGEPIGFLGEDGRVIDGRPRNNFARGSHVIPREFGNRHYELQDGKLTVRSSKNLDRREVKLPFKGPTAIVPWLDEGHLVIADPADKWIWAFRIEKDGSLGPGDRYYSLFVRRGETRSEVTELEIDNRNRVYAASKEGIQVFDPTGRLSGVFTKASNTPVTAMGFGGSMGNVLFVAHGKDVYFRKMTAQGYYIPFKK